MTLKLPESLLQQIGQSCPWGSWR